MLVKEQPKPANNNQPIYKVKGKIMAIVVESDDVEDHIIRGTILINYFQFHVL